MSDYKRTVELVEIAQNSAGRSSEQFAKYQDTLEMKIKRLQNTWEQFRVKIGRSDIFKNVVDDANSTLKKGTELDWFQILGLATVGVTLGRRIVTSLIEQIRDTSKQFARLGNEMGNALFSGVTNATNKSGKTIASKIGNTLANRKYEKEYAQYKKDYEQYKTDLQLYKQNEVYPITGKMRDEAYRKILPTSAVMPSEMAAATRKIYDLYYREAANGTNPHTAEYANALSEYETARARLGVEKFYPPLTKFAPYIEKTTKEFYQNITQQTKALEEQLMRNAPVPPVRPINNGYQPRQRTPEQQQDIEKFKTRMSSSITLGLQSALTIGLMDAFAGNDLSSILSTSLKTFAITAIPSAIQAIGPVVIKSLTSVLGVSAGAIGVAFTAAAAAIGLLIAHVKKIQKEEQEAINKAVNLSSNIKGIVEDLESTYTSAKKATKQMKDAQEKYNDFIRLSSKTFLSEKEEETLESAKDYFSGLYPDLEDEIRNGTADLARLLQDIKEQGEASENIKASKMVYSALNANQNIDDVIKLLDKMNSAESGRTTTKKILKMMSIAPDLDYSSVFEDNEQALRHYKEGDTKSAVSLMFSPINKTAGAEFRQRVYDFIISNFDNIVEEANEDLYTQFAKSANASADATDFMKEALKNTQLLNSRIIELTTAEIKSLQSGVIPKTYQDALSKIDIDISNLSKDGKLLSLSEITDEKTSTWINSVFGEEKWNEIIGDKKKDFKNAYSTLITIGQGFDLQAQKILEKTEQYEKLATIIKNDEGLTTAEVEQKAKELIKQYDLGVDITKGDNLFTKFQKNVESLSNLGVTAAKELSPRIAQLIVSSLQSLNLADSSSAAKIIDNAINKTDAVTIANIPLDNLATLTATEAQTYIQLLEDGGKSAEDAQRIFWEYINKMRLVTSRNLTNVEQIDVLREDNETFFESYISNLELIQKAQSDIQKSGFVSTSTRKAMVKANINKKYLDGIGLNEQAVKDFTITAMQPYQNALQQLESSKMAVDSLSKFDRDKFNYGLKYYQLDENFFDSYIGKTYMGYTPTQMEEIKAAAQSGAKSYDEYAAKLNNVVKELNNFPAEQAINGLTVIKEATEANKDAIDKLEKEILKLKKTIHNNDKSIHRLGRQIRDAEKDWLAATEGSENFRSSLDGLVNYTNQMSDLERSIERVGKALENATEQSGSDSLITGLRDSLVNKAGLIQAERRVIESAMDNIAANLTTSFGNVFSVNENGLMNIDIGAFEKLRMSDTFKKEGGEALFNQYNQYYEQREQLIDNAEEVLKAFKDYQKQYLDAVVQAENDVASILEKQNEEEIDNLKDKYAAMEKADNEYLDALEKAINKQRKLRELENDYDDLATKRKKLSLMQRDTSGASQKDILSLSKDIKKSEESVLDKEVDNLIDELKELAETEKDTRDAELEYQEALKETVNWMLLAKDAMSKWTSVEDARAWRLSDPKFDELTEEQQEQELLKVEELYKSYINYLSSSKVEWKNNMEAIANKETEYYKNTFENVSNVGSAILQDAQEKADKERQDTAEKLEDLRQNLEDMEEQQAENLKELAEKETELANLRKSSEQQYLESINIMQEAAKSGFVDVAAFGLQQMASLQSIQFNDLFNEDGSTNTNSAGYKWLSDNGQINNGQISLPGLLAAGQGQTTGKVWGIIGEDGKLIKLNQSAVYNGSEQGYYTDEKKAAADLNKLMTSSKGTFKGFLKQFAEGGLVNFTGPAWVDGTSSRPEAFLSADDTFRIGKAAELLANLPIFNRANDSISTNIGDTSIEIHLNIDKLASDYDVERMLDKVKENIVRIAKPIGSSVILSK